MTDEETYAGPFTVDDGPDDKRGITKAVASRALAEPGFDAGKASNYWRNAASRGLLHPYRRKVSAKRPHFLYHPEQVLICGILIRMSEAGFTGEGIFARAASALQAFSVRDVLSPEQITAGEKPNFPCRNPASWAFRNYLAGHRGFTFELVAFRREDSGFLDHRARLIQYPSAEGTDWHMGPEWKRRSVWALDLDPILEHLTREKGVLH